MRHESNGVTAIHLQVEKGSLTIQSSCNYNGYMKG